MENQQWTFGLNIQRFLTRALQWIFIATLFWILTGEGAPRGNRYRKD